MDVETWNKNIGGFYFFLFKFAGKQKSEALQAILLNPLTICSSCKRKFAVCTLAGKETNGKYPFANEPKGLAYLQYEYRQFCTATVQYFSSILSWVLKIIMHK
jgi:hypothetical protein